jgi:hypothetical protein
MFKFTELTSTFGDTPVSSSNPPRELVEEAIDLLLHPKLNPTADNVVYIEQTNKSFPDGRPWWDGDARSIYFWRTHGGVFVEYADSSTDLGPLYASKGSPDGMGQHVYGGNPVLLPNECIISEVTLLQRIALEFLRGCEKAPAIVPWISCAMVSVEAEE